MREQRSLKITCTAVGGKYSVEAGEVNFNLRVQVACEHDFTRWFSAFFSPITSTFSRPAIKATTSKTVQPNQKEIEIGKPFESWTQ